MLDTAPLDQLHHQAEAEFTTFPPARSVFGDDMAPIDLVASFGDAPAEFAALAVGAGLLDLPHRAALTLVGDDRIAFLNQMLTQELKDLSPGRSRRSFWLNRKGRIEADLRVIHLPDRTLLTSDRADSARTLESLSAFIITEDVEIQDHTETAHHLSLIGLEAINILTRASTPVADSASSELAPGCATELEIVGAQVVAAFDTELGVPRCELTMPRDAALRVYQHLLETGFSLAGTSSERFRAIGFTAFNTLRVQVGEPMARLDFGIASLPHETGVVRERVSFTKGCYLGQEIVARMQSLGHPKQRLVALNFDHKSALPEAGELLFQTDNPDADSVGVVTSAIANPARNGASTIFAQVRHDHSTLNNTLQTKVGDLGVIQNDFSTNDQLQ